MLACNEPEEKSKALLAYTLRGDSGKLKIWTSVRFALEELWQKGCSSKYGLLLCIDKRPDTRSKANAVSKSKVMQTYSSGRLTQTLGIQVAEKRFSMDNRWKRSRESSRVEFANWVSNRVMYFQDIARMLVH